jgi:cystathionine beta-lyase/cystathionine gamma-synthase
MDLSFILNELGEERDQYFNAVAPPVVQSSNFAYRDVASLREALAQEFDAMLYSRGNNPTVSILRKKLAALDGAEDALVFSSGMAAIFCAVFSQVSQGDHIVSVEKPYPWTDKLFRLILPRFGVTTTMVDGTRVENFEDAIQTNTKLIYLESPCSFTFALQDIAAVAAMARSRGILTMIDNSYCSPLYQKPIEMGVDMALQTATKYIGGHSDTLAGVLTGSTLALRKIFAPDFMTIGSSIAPFQAWLLLRSLRTLEVRLERISASTERVAAFVEQHPAVEKIYYPFSASHPQAALARRQMKKAPGLFSAVLKAKTLAQVETFCASLRRFLMAVSWGGHESLIIPACATIRAEDFDASNPLHRQVRFYIGLEDLECLIEDIRQALAKL